jgi:hypothetical protein
MDAAFIAEELDSVTQSVISHTEGYMYIKQLDDLYGSDKVLSAV